MKGKLTRRQEKVLQVIRAHIQEHGYPPTQEEIAGALDLKWTRAVEKHLQALEKKGYISKGKGARALRLVSDARSVPVPLLGSIAAGGPIVSEEHIEQFIALDAGLLPSGECFLLRVAGDSMRGAGIYPNDLVLIRSQQVARKGDIAAFLLDGAVTVKYFFPEKQRILLRPANPSYRDIIVTAENEVHVLGKVVALLRHY